MDKLAAITGNNEVAVGSKEVVQVSAKRFRSVLALASVLSLGAISAVAAEAPGFSGDALPTEQGVEEVLFDDGSVRVSVETLPMEEPAVRPAPGRTVTVQEGDEVTTYYGVSASCTHSVTVFAPIRYPQLNQIEASGKISNSSGCVDRRRLEVFLAKDATWGWSAQKSGSTNAAPGETKTVKLVLQCTNTKSTSWRTEATEGTSRKQVSSTVKFNCGT